MNKIRFLSISLIVGCLMLTTTAWAFPNLTLQRVVDNAYYGSHAPICGAHIEKDIENDRLFIEWIQNPFKNPKKTPCRREGQTEPAQCPEDEDTCLLSNGCGLTGMESGNFVLSCPENGGMVSWTFHWVKN